VKKLNIILKINLEKDLWKLRRRLDKWTRQSPRRVKKQIETDIIIKKLKIYERVRNNEKKTEDTENKDQKANNQRRMKVRIVRRTVIRK